MKAALLNRALAVACFVIASAGAQPAAHAQMKVGVISSATGPTAVVGIPQKNTVPLLPRKIGEIDVEYRYQDDESDPTQTVMLVKKLLSAHVDAIIGPSGSPNAIGAIQFIAEAKTPLLAPVGSPAVVLPMDAQKRWVFKTTQNDSLIADALVSDMKKRGIKTVGFIGFADPYGESWFKTFTPMAEKAGIRLSANERFQRTDQSVIGQVAQIMSANPEAVLIAGTGGPTALPQITLRERGYQGRIYQTHGAATPDFIRLAGKAAEGTIMAASLMLVLNEIPDGNASKKVANDYIAAYEKLYGKTPATFGANVYDAGLLLQSAVPEAAKKARPGTVEFRSALRDALEKTKGLVGTQGVYDMTPEDHSGFDERGRVLMVLKDGAWHRLDE